MEQAGRLTASFTEEDRYRILVDAITDYAVYMLDERGIVSSWNTGARRFKGYEADEILGQHFSVFYTPDDIKAGIPALALKEAETKGKFEAEGWRVRKNGTRFWAYVIIDPIRDNNGRLVGFAKVTRDLSERKEAERKLGEAREALFQAQKMEAVGRLTGGIAHDFNNLLMVILASLDMLKRKMPKDEKLNALLDNALQGAQRGAALTQKMLSFARRQKLDLRAVDLGTLIHGMAGLLQRSLGSEVSIETRFPLNLPPVRTDENQLENALLNLVVNARDAMPNETGTIIISARREVIEADSLTGLVPGTYVCLSVQDNGVGMDAETLMRATEPFFTTKGPGKGTGLGLSMVHGLAQQSGGTLRIASTPKKGTTIEIWFPAAISNDADMPAQGTSGDVPLTPLRPLNILVVDDDALVLTNTMAMLEDLGHKAVPMTSAQAALDHLRQGHVYDMLITDQAMPNMTGLQLIENVRKSWPDMPVVLATGYAEVNPAGINLPTIMKPFSQDQIAAFIGKIYKA